jgi:superfamily II DNA or RNA helicase
MPDVAPRTSAKALPEVGHLVRVRDRHWVVTDLAASSLPPDVVGGEQTPSHLVSLSSVEDDGFGDELTVFWELEPATEVLPQATLPEPAAGAFDPPERLAAFLDAVRWGAIASADTHALQAPFRSGITIEDYQLDPVARALRMPRANLLIADDVGLGKTIEAGLVVQELLLRHRARSVLIVCPASLCLKWQDEMRDRFGLDFRIAGSDAVKALRRERGLAANVWTSFPRLIVSIDWLKRPRAQALLDEVLPPDPARFPRTVDLLILDEAHQCAPAGRGAYATDSLRTRALQRLAPHCEHRLFLSATPSNGYTESFTALLQLLDPQRFARGVKPPPELLRRVMVRRLKSELRAQLPPKPDGTPRFAERRVLPLVVDYPEEERRIHRVLAEYTELRKRHAAGDHLAVTATEFVTLLLKKRLFSSPRAFLRTLLEHQRTLRRAGAARVTEQQLRADFDRADEDLDDDEALNEATSDALSSAARATRPLTADERARLQEMIAWAERETHRADAKARVLLDWLRRTCVPDGQWNDERVIVFTEYRDTQVWLHELLASQGVPAERVALLYGGLEADKRERIKAEFQAPPHRSPVRLLLATDAASEGIDLQLHCHRVVHVEIPFNPARLEQRNGRVDRFGQPHPTVEVYHFVGKDYERAAPGTIDGDLDFLFRIAQRIETIREDQGSTGDVIARQVEEAMLGRRREVDETAIESSRTKLSRAVLRLERDLRDEILKLREQLDASIDQLGIRPDAVARVVTTALALARQPALRPLRKAGCFEVPALTHSWALATLGLKDPLDERQRPITFDHAVAGGDRDVVLAHLGHRLVAQSCRLLRAELWKTGGDRALSRVTACVVDDGALDEIAVLAHARLVVTGADGHRLHEEVIAAGGRVRHQRFARFNVGEVKAALRAMTAEPVGEGVQRRLAADWPAIQPQVFRGVEARADDLIAGLQKRLAERAEEDAAAVDAVLRELQRTIQARLRELEGEAGQQMRLAFGTEDERQQFARDLDGLRRRLAEIPDEIAREQQAVRRRYSTPSPRVFPAAVTFLVPRRLAR